MLYKKMIEEILSDVQLEYKNKLEELRSLPTGSLLSIKQKGKIYYYRYLPPKGFRNKIKRVGISRDPKMIRSLARKKLLEEECSLLCANIASLKKLLSSYSPLDETALVSQMRGAYSTLHPDTFNPVVPGSESTQHYQFTFRENELVQLTSSGLRVRSKSELVIVGRLEHFRLDFIYEPRLDLGDRFFRPDFQIPSKRTGKTIFWEHAGMMEDFNYMKKFQEKLSVYYEHGIVPWKNLIMTYDNADGGLDVRVVDAMITAWLL